MDRTTRSIFEVLGSYVTDLFFNHIYSSARTGAPPGSSVTDEFTRQAKTFVMGVKNDERCYADVVKQAHAMFQATTRYTALSFVDFVDRVVGVCVPPEYFADFTAGEKDELLSSVLCDLISHTAVAATKPDMLRRIIDARTSAPDVTIRMLQDAAVEALFAKRATLHNKFLGKLAQTRDSVPSDVVEGMKRALKRLVHERNEARADAREAEDRVEDYRARLHDAKARAAKLERLVELLRLGRDEGPAAALAAQRIPVRERLAEREPPRRHSQPRQERLAERPPPRHHSLPRRERLAEAYSPSASETGSEEGSSADSAYSDETASTDTAASSAASGGRRGRGRGAKRGRGSPKAPARGRRAPAAPSSALADFFRPVAPPPPAPASGEGRGSAAISRLVQGDFDLDGDEEEE